MALIKYFKNPKKIEYLPLLERIQSDDEQVKSAVMNIMEDVKKIMACSVFIDMEKQIHILTNPKIN